MSEANRPPVFFGIPLISKAAALDWAIVTHQVSATLGSLMAQTSPNFRVFVAGTDEPDTPFKRDPRYEFLQVLGPTEFDYESRRVDMEWKRKAIATRVHALGGGYIMFVDSDDLVSSKLVEYVDAHPHPSGYLITTGYILHASTGDLAPYPMPEFTKPLDQICGSTAVVRLSPHELPDGTGERRLFDYLFGSGHVLVRKLTFESDRPLAKLPFRAVVYVRANNQNMSTRIGYKPEFVEGYLALERNVEKRRIERTAELDLEFNIPAAILGSRAVTAASD